MRSVATPMQMVSLSPAARQKLETWSEESSHGLVSQISIEDMIDYFNDNNLYVRCEQWVDDKTHHWRVGLNWKGAEDYYYITEQEDLVDGLFECLRYILEQKN